MVGQRIILSIALVAMCSMVSKAQLAIDWEQLTDVTFEEKYYERYDTDYWYPTFGESVKKLDGVEVQITGYVVAVEPETGFYVLSANPFSQCFFCGNAGPETVIQLNFKSWPREYENDEYLTFSGTLRLNAENLFELNYIIEDAEEVKP